ncbi:hypothetical protein CK203_112664 [Vitis vinifera]|uniref:Transposase-associated domain-containing protein n=1 Tax=Vitis vinifera TaxID=29760 RepID=A0A438C524_VITVI|nr:hypothetical protein CK203_112664 [Vitis vinifera]
MDRSWMSKDRMSREYEEGVEYFINFALEHCPNQSGIRCPCMRCGNLIHHTPNKIREHMFFNGIDQSYHTWYWHGEAGPTSRQPTEMAQCYDTMDCGDVASTVQMVHVIDDEFMTDPMSFKKLLEDAEKPLYPGCIKFTKLSALVKLYNVKARYGWSDKSFSDLLQILGDMLPVNNEMPLSMYEAKKTLNALGMEYKKIHACPNDCILYRNELNDASLCPTCGTSRWKVNKVGARNTKRIPAKVLWYFPPIPRFKRMFQSPKIAKDLKWHAKGRENDGKLRHPVDSPTWQLVNQMWPEFASDCRNLRLAISADGINPHSSMTSRHSCWPVLTITYNLPPWLCMKRKFMMLSLLISGPRQPGKDIDVYLAPLVDDLKALWEVGVKAYDAHQREFFTLKAILLWTINDFPAYGNLSGCTVKGYHACPICEKNVCESIIGTVLNIPGKTKDGVKSRLDLLEMGLRPGLAPTFGLKRTYLPPACYTLKLKLNGLKSHDYHALMQQLLPVAIRSVLPKHVRYAITRLCFFFNALCAKVVDVSRLNDLQQDIVVILCLLEKYFPPSIFDIMLHLTVHLVREVRLCGPVYMRWMYPFERYMKVLKGYVRNHNRPEGCIAECYIAEEALEFCTEYLSGMDAIGIPSSMKDEWKCGKPLLGGRAITIHDYKLVEQAHHYVSDDISKKEPIEKELKWLAQGPRQQVLTYPGYIIHGCRYHIKNVMRHESTKIVVLVLWHRPCKLQVPKIRILCLCDWVDSKNGVKVDELGFTLVDLSK